MSPRVAWLSLALALWSSAPAAQEISPRLLTGRWDAHWIRPRGIAPAAFAVFHARRTFHLESVPPRFVVHVSGDNRYELFVNGRRVLTGPARGDLDHWRFETAEIAAFLRPGRNVLAAIVWNFAEAAPMAQATHETAFILQGDGEVERVVDTGRGWKVHLSDAHSLVPLDRASIDHQYYVGGPGEQTDAARVPWGWEAADFDDNAWAEPAVIVVGAPRGVRDTPSRWMLVPRTIPPLEDAEERFARVARVEPAAAVPPPPAAWLAGRSPWIVPPGREASVLLDRGVLTTAYPEIVLSGGRGATVSVAYAESLRAVSPSGPARAKGHRDDVEGKSIAGLTDRVLPDGGRGRLFRPLWWRAFRYAQVTVRTGAEPLVIEDVRARVTGYPMAARGGFSSPDDTDLGRIFEVGWRTARVCAGETFMDTPYWEQLQYVGDTRIQALIALHVAGDDRLVRNAIALFDASRIPDGLTLSRAPTRLPQVIPPFSLSWVGMLHDLHAWGGDAAFAARYLPGAAAVLDWFWARRAPSGLLGRLEWWNFVDWVDGGEFRDGEPPHDATGESVILSLQFALALREAADLEEAAGEAARAVVYRARADAVVSAVRATAWDAARRRFGDTPSKRTFSQHANALAVLADAVPPGEAAALMRAVLDDSSVTSATYYFQFYVARALAAAGLGDAYLSRLGPWRDMLGLGLTTWAEKPEPTRSDSHAWSAHPTLHLLTIVAGVTPAGAGFRAVRVRPSLGPLSRASARVATPHGTVEVTYRRTGARLDAEVRLPPGVAGTIEWEGAERPLREGFQHLSW